MNIKKLSIAAILALSTSAYAVESSGAITAYYMDDEAASDPVGDMAITVNVTEKVNKYVSLNATLVGVSSLNSTLADGKIQEDGGVANVANVTLKLLQNTTVVAGRQLLDTPMLYSFDWLLKPVGFEAIALVNSDIPNTTLVAASVSALSGNDSLDFVNLDGDNYAGGAIYGNESYGYNAQLWYYNVDAANYTQLYLDASKSFGDVTVSAQYAGTDYDAKKVSTRDSDAFGLKVETSMNGIDLALAYSDVQDGATGYVGGDSMFTSSWNTFASDYVDSAVMASVGTEINGIGLTLSYADYMEDAKEMDFIAEYSINDALGFTAVYSDTDWNDGAGSNSVVELIASYSF